MAERDPLVASHFALEIQGVVSAFFKGASGFSNETEIIEHKAVDSKGREVIQKVPGATKWGDITLQRGITDDQNIWKWRQQVIEGKVAQARKDGSVIMYNQQDKEIARFNFHNGWPSSWKGPDVSADNNAIGIEEITITHEGLVRAQ